MISLNKCYFKPIPGHRYYMPAHIFTKDTAFLTLPFKNQKNVLITTNNDTIAAHIAETYGCKSAVYPVFVARNIAEEMNIDMVMLINCSSELDNKEEAYDIWYLSHQDRPVEIFKLRMNEWEI